MRLPANQKIHRIPQLGTNAAFDQLSRDVTDIRTELAQMEARLNARIDRSTSTILGDIRCLKTSSKSV